MLQFVSFVPFCYTSSKEKILKMIFELFNKYLFTDICFLAHESFGFPKILVNQHKYVTLHLTLYYALLVS